MCINFVNKDMPYDDVLEHTDNMFLVCIINQPSFSTWHTNTAFVNFQLVHVLFDL